MNCYIIGNGFDLHNNLDTRYVDFKNFIAKYDKVVVEWFDSILINNGHTEEEIQKWSDLESYLSEIHELNYNDILDYSIRNSEDDSDRASYWSDPNYNVDEYTSKIKNMMNRIKVFFKLWIDALDFSKALVDNTLNFGRNDLYINFNYTNTLERLYNIPQYRIFYVHLSYGNYILGHNELLQIPYKNPRLTTLEESFGRVHIIEDQNFRAVQVKEQLNVSCEEMYHVFYKNSSSIIQHNPIIFDNLINSDVLYIMGLSIGKQDLIYFSYLATKDVKWKKIVIYYLDDSELKYKKEKIIKLFPNIKIESIKWIDLK